MAHEMDDNVLSQVYEVLVDKGFDRLGVDFAAERGDASGAQPTPAGSAL
jgi:hypothetical protein